MEKAARQPGFVQLDNRVLTQYAARIGPSALSVYLALSKFADRTTRTCYPSHDTIGRLLGLSRPTVLKAIRTLEEVGLVAVKRQRTERCRARSHVYTLLSLNEGGAETLPRPGETHGRPSKGSIRPPGKKVDSEDSLQRPGKNLDTTRKESLQEQDPINKTQGNDTARGATAPPPGPAPLKVKCVTGERTRAEEPRSPEPSSRPRDPNLDHPAVQAYRRECKLTPNEAQRAEIAATVSDIAAWEQVMKQWQLLGYRKNNVAGMLDWYKKGIPERSHGHGNHGVGSGLGSFGHRAGGGYRPRPPETPEERARLDAEWESLARRSGSMAGINDGGEV